jgi:hypothetical protein
MSKYRKAIAAIVATILSAWIHRRMWVLIVS